MKLSDVKNNLSRYVERVRHGERIRILVRGVPVADLVPVHEGLASADDRANLDELERRGLIRRGTVRLDPQLFEPGPAAKGKPLSAYLLEERAEGR